LIILYTKVNAQVVPFSFVSSKVETIILPEPITVEGMVWSKNNLNVTKYRNGDDITYINDADTWIGITSGARSYYNFDPNEASKGKYYNGYAVLDEQVLAPAG
jgi:hypothetical protein